MPEELIARYPLEKRDSSRLLLGSKLSIKEFPHLVDTLNPGDLIVLNDTRVQPARLAAQKKVTGGKISMLVLELHPEDKALVIYKSSHPLHQGQFILCGDAEMCVEHICTGGQAVLKSNIPWQDVMEKYGQVPLPPYLKRDNEEADKERYQSVWAKELGSSAAPTASLHFTPEIIEKLVAKGVHLSYCTLHVGLGTFLPVHQGDLEKHVMHQEWFCVPQSTLDAIKRTQGNGGKVVAVGTTVMRALESVPAGTTETTQGFTNLFIRPGFKFRFFDQLLTNFHQVDSTLILLVQAFAGKDTIKRCYAYAIEQSMRLYSYGDCVLLEREDSV